MEDHKKLKLHPYTWLELYKKKQGRHGGRVLYTVPHRRSFLFVRQHFKHSLHVWWVPSEYFGFLPHPKNMQLSQLKQAHIWK